MSEGTLQPHPRLYASEAALARLREAPERPLLRAAAAHVTRRAAEYVHSPVFAFDPNVHNALLLRARTMQSRVVTLLVRWFQTDDRAYRDAAVAHVAEMGTWEYWAWDLWRRQDPRPEAMFDLSYGENSLTLALAYDWLYPTLTEDERRLFLDVALRRSFRPFLAQTDSERPPSWFGRPDSNWNTVCSGGAGALALAMFEALPEAPRVLALAERSVVPFMRFLERNGGGWPEGLGYWNYGMRYAFIYLLSHERATGRPHPLLELPETKQTLSFPFDFCPHGRPSGFGDVNQWRPLPFHYAAAVRLGAPTVLAALDASLEHELAREALRDSRADGNGSIAGSNLFEHETWPDAAELLLCHPRGGQGTAPAPAERPVARLYRGMDWGVLADQLPNPQLYLSVRGGTTEVSHSHMDLLSFHCVVGGEALVSNLGVDEYLDTTFSARRFELFETAPPSKNTIMINGIGITRPATVATELVDFGVAGKARGAGAGDLWAIRIDATAAMGESRGGPAATFCGRLFVMVRDVAVVIVDRVELPYPGRVESRLHTWGSVRLAGAPVSDSAGVTEPAGTAGPTAVTGAEIAGTRQRLRVAYACSVPATLTRAGDALTTPPKDGAVPTMLRWCTSSRLHTAVTMVTLLSPGAAPATVVLSETGGGLEITASGADWQQQLRVTPHLRPWQAA